jgi:hypothetical protein
VLFETDGSATAPAHVLRSMLGLDLLVNTRLVGVMAASLLSSASIQSAGGGLLVGRILPSSVIRVCHLKLHQRQKTWEEWRMALGDRGKPGSTQ